MRLRTTALPSFFVTVKPNLGPSIGGAPGGVGREGFVSNTKEGVANREPPLSLRNSARFLSVTSVKSNPPGYAREGLSRPGDAPNTRPKDACGPWHGGGREPSRHQPSACERGSHGGACERAYSVDRCASRENSVRNRKQLRLARKPHEAAEPHPDEPIVGQPWNGMAYKWERLRSQCTPEVDGATQGARRTRCCSKLSLGDNRARRCLHHCSAGRWQQHPPEQSGAP